MYRYPLLSAAMGTGFNFMVLSALALVAWFRFFATSWRDLDDNTDYVTSSASTSSESDDEGAGPAWDDEDSLRRREEKKLKKKRSSSARSSKRSRESQYGVILDEAVEDIEEEGKLSEREGKKLK